MKKFYSNSEESTESDESDGLYSFLENDNENGSLIDEADGNVSNSVQETNLQDITHQPVAASNQASNQESSRVQTYPEVENESGDDLMFISSNNEDVAMVQERYQDLEDEHGDNLMFDWESIFSWESIQNLAEGTEGSEDAVTFTDAFPMVKVEQGEHFCCICSESMETLKKLPCGHGFHQHCIDAWLRRKLTCPICRCQIKANT